VVFAFYRVFFSLCCCFVGLSDAFPQTSFAKMSWQVNIFWKVYFFSDFELANLSVYCVYLWANACSFRNDSYMFSTFIT